MDALGQLIHLEQRHSAPLDAFMAEFSAKGEEAYGFAVRDVLGASYTSDEAIRLLDALHRGERLPQGWVPSTTWGWEHEGALQGLINLRHRLTPALENFGGHIGYSVAPSFRRRGIATAMLAAVLEVCRQRHMERILITCDAENIASARTIERQGGRLEREAWHEGTQRVQRWYWIELSS